MSIKRMFSLFVGLTFVAVVVLTVRAGSATSEVVSSPKAALDQHERHAGFVNLGLARAESARLEYRQGEWTAAHNLYALLDAQERHAAANMAAEPARLEYRQGEWNAGANFYAPLDAQERHAAVNMAAEPARLEYRRGEWYASAPTSAVALDQHERHLGLISSSPLTADQARFEYRQGEWDAGALASAIALDQHERHVGFINLGVARAEQARMEYRLGEWNAGANFYAPLDAQERHALVDNVGVQARLDYRRGEWNAGSAISLVKFDIEQARLQWRVGE